MGRPHLVFFLLLFRLVGVGGEEYVVATYNVENLFDAVEDGAEYDEFRPSSFWTEEKVLVRLEAVSRVVRSLDADVLILQEVENERVLGRLVSGYLADAGYRWHFLPEEEGAVHVAVLSRIPVEGVRVHALKDPRVAVLRSVVEVEYRLGGEQVFLFGVHLISRAGPAWRDEIRRNQLFLIARRLEEIRRTAPGAHVLVGGDFNMEADEVETFFDRALFPQDVHSVWSMMVPGTMPSGSYWYEGRWERIDGFFFTEGLRDGVGLDVTGGEVMAFPWLLDERGRPWSWDMGTGSGYSDHLPVKVILTDLTRMK
ncbi:Endonuclease/exonuclease/phosphatase [Spirochaeta thermophila DSM 6578]|uniref:Endonuclease/exonuclease/phosphatase n=1 Tax=Winmispira thermophila (strain ATCC 700085 / DSM 6578 / Z-1203) TaxID=869211 RepID=G0G9V5_WINT7|nr:endonuclease/exonuclease/phosphatase family protein [Spirochaeta thermophila]AEJ60855.1 Endonuclease/exonuclease/phosphatase [Spirochaeta thermophila DSM 6578]